MPLIKQFNILGADVFLWDLSETNHEIALALGVEDKLVGEEFEYISNRNTFGWQYVFKNILGINYSGIYKDIFGKPFLNNSSLNISVSHTKQLIACAIHPNKSIGIDIENCSEKIERVKHKFLSDIELNQFCSNTDLTIAWCIKESVFKLQGQKGVSFKNDINILINEPNKKVVFFKDKCFDFESMLIDNMVMVLSVDN